MEAKTHYTRVGFVVMILTFALILAIIWLSVGFGKLKYTMYTVHLHEAVSGLTEQSPVKYNGVQVGSVERITLSERSPREVDLVLAIEKNTPVTTSTVATLIAQGITGNTYVGLSATSDNLTPLKALPGERYPVIPDKPSLLNQLDRALKDVSLNINNLSNRLNRVLDEQNTKNFKETLQNIQHITTSLNNHVDDMTVGFNKLMGSLHEASSRVAREVDRVGPSVTQAMDAGRVAFNKLSQQALPPIIVLLQKFDRIANNLESVSAAMRQNPSVIIRGRAMPKTGPGE